MEDLTDVYNDLIMEHSMNSYNKKKLEDAIAFKNVSNMPARVKCALLAWHTVEGMLNGRE